MADVKTLLDGDLDLDTGLKIADDHDRDRHLVMVRAFTFQGDMKSNPELGVNTRSIGRSITADLLHQVEQDVTESLYRGLGLLDTNLAVRAIPTGRDEVLVLIQVNKRYGEMLDKLIISGQLWNPELPITKLDGTEG